MNDRKQLHALIDSLPEGVLDSAEKYLQSIQTWPRREAEHRAKVAQFKKELEQKRDEFLKGCGVNAIGQQVANPMLSTIEALC